VFLQVLLLHELSVMAGKAPKHYMEMVCSTGIASTMSWFVFYFFADKTFVDSSHSKLAVYDIVTNITPYKQEWLAEAALFGVLGGLLGLVTLVCMGVFRSLGERLMRMLGHRRGTFLLPIIGGLAIGILGVYFPLTFGDGSLQLSKIIGNNDGFGRDYLLATLFVKMVTLGISLGFGFVGGQIFPCIFIGCCAGAVTHLVSNVPVIVTVPCFMAAVPGAFCPAPFTFVMIVSLSLSLGPQLTTLVFTSTFCSFITACGTGLLQRMVKQGGERTARLEAKHAAKIAKKAEALKERLRSLEAENSILRRINSKAGSSPLLAQSSPSQLFNMQGYRGEHRGEGRAASMGGAKTPAGEKKLNRPVNSPAGGPAGDEVLQGGEGFLSGARERRAAETETSGYRRFAGNSPYL